jgi:hypothetical protein
MSVASLPPPPAPPQSASSQAVTAFVLGLLGLTCCPLVGPVAWYLGKQEAAAIAAGRSPASGEGIAKAGFILGILGSIYLAGGLLWMFFLGGMAFLSALFNH